ncbi:MAG: lipocalin family protein [Alistipes sp.]|nr:lipocalin family protein [Alistipes sp.]
MNRLLKLLPFVAALLVYGCKKPVEVSPYKDVTPHNISGTWRLESWNGGLAADTEVYIIFERAERTFVMYDNLRTDYLHKSTGRYNITTDANLGAIIIGEYDNGAGPWSDRYVVRELTDSSMKFIAKSSLEDDVPGEDVSLYVRAELPSEIEE